ncbi:hypothetical protein BK635_17300 [Pseudomonas chlororaphis]|uniref:hypothetical protein n=1 Tax=Pseudomonas chlororaphis TaxID=587753 RepID=UPI000F49C78B|nr:hypothetical protein [Pseudomonas chlororaphis]RON80059.1 hypothetical protein BK635_17300 [Pseudomonas chlororaphis]
MGHFPSWMLQSAHNYLKASEVLDAQATSRKTADKHDLLTLFHAMPEAIRSSLSLDSQEDSFERYRDVFTNSRYPYESNSWKFSDPVLMRLLRWTLANVVGYYKAQGSQDPFVLDYIVEVQVQAAAE